MCGVITKCQWNSEYLYTHKTLKESGIIDKRRIKLYTGL